MVTQTALVRVLEGAEPLGEMMNAFDKIQPNLVVIKLIEISFMKVKIHLHLLHIRQICHHIEFRS